MSKTIVRESKQTGDMLIVEKSGWIASYTKNVWATGNVFTLEAEEKMPIIVDQNHINKLLKQAHDTLDKPIPVVPEAPHPVPTAASLAEKKAADAKLAAAKFDAAAAEHEAKVASDAKTISDKLNK